MSTFKGKVQAFKATLNKEEVSQEPQVSLCLQKPIFI